MKTTQIKGIIPPIVTPMNADESVNIPELRSQVERQIAGGVHGIFPFGTNGEGYILSLKEKEEILEAVVDQVKGRIPVYAGSGCISTQESGRKNWAPMCCPSSLPASPWPARRNCMTTMWKLPST